MLGCPAGLCVDVANAGEQLKDVHVLGKGWSSIMKATYTSQLEMLI